MKDEYKSAMLWYRDDRQAMKQKPIEEDSVQKDTLSKKLSGLLKKSEKQPRPKGLFLFYLKPCPYFLLFSKKSLMASPSPSMS